MRNLVTFANSWKAKLSIWPSIECRHQSLPTLFWPVHILYIKVTVCLSVCPGSAWKILPGTTRTFVFFFLMSFIFLVDCRRGWGKGRAWWSTGRGGANTGEEGPGRARGTGEEGLDGRKLDGCIMQQVHTNNHETNKGIKVYQDCLNWVFFMTNFVAGSNSFIKKRSLWDDCHHQDSYPMWTFVDESLTM
jgi:hypothetical protein